MTKRTRWVTASVGVLAVLLYVVVSLVQTLPANPVTNSMEGLATATRPYFAQKWNVFAPNIAQSNPQLRVQAQWYEDGERVHSDWVNVTDIELRSVPGHAIPSRIQKSSYNAINNYLSRYSDLNDDQALRVRDTFVRRAEGGGFAAIPSQTLVDELSGMGDNSGDVISFLRYDYILKEYMTYFTTAYFDEDVIRVRWQVYRERPNDYDRRFDENTQYEASTLTFGWRHVDDRIRPEALDVFDDVIERYGRDANES